MSAVSSVVLDGGVDEGEDMQDGEEIHYEADQQSPTFQVRFQTPLFPVFTTVLYQGQASVVARQHRSGATTCSCAQTRNIIARNKLHPSGPQPNNLKYISTRTVRLQGQSCSP